MYCDYHVHSAYSDDSTYPMEDVVKDAIKKGINEICFCDHVDYGIKADWSEGKPVQYRMGMPLMNVNYPNYFDELEFLQNKYGKDISIKKGLEFGIQLHTIEKYQKLFNIYDLDFVLLSCHQINDKEFWNGEFQKGKTQLEYNREYYEEILNIISKYKDYSVLAHLDLIVRYDEKGAINFDCVKDIIEKILKQVIQDGKGIEVNTSCHRYGLKDLTPSLDILKMYQSLGGKIITMGSDSHKPEHLGAYINETKRILKNLGFSHYCTFERMKPKYYEL